MNMFELHFYMFVYFISYLQVYLHFWRAKENSWKYSSSFKVTFEKELRIPQFKNYMKI